MAQHTVTSGCGHTTTLQLYGPMQERERRLTWMRSPTGMCNPCYAQSKRNEETAIDEDQVREILWKAKQEGLDPAQAAEGLRKQLKGAPESVLSTRRGKAALIIIERYGQPTPASDEPTDWKARC